MLLANDCNTMLWAFPPSCHQSNEYRSIVNIYKCMHIVFTNTKQTKVNKHNYVIRAMNTGSLWMHIFQKYMPIVFTNTKLIISTANVFHHNCLFQDNCPNEYFAKMALVPAQTHPLKLHSVSKVSTWNVLKEPSYKKIVPLKISYFDKYLDLKAL